MALIFAFYRTECRTFLRASTADVNYTQLYSQKLTTNYIPLLMISIGKRDDNITGKM